MLKMTRIFCLGAAFFLTACSGTGDKPDSVANTSMVHDPDAITCRNEAKTGSRVSQKVCRTNRTWDAISASGREQLESFRNAPVGTSGG